MPAARTPAGNAVVARCARTAGTAGLAARLPDGPVYLAAYDRAVEVMQREKGLHPNTDLPIGLILYLLDVPIELFTPIFLCARTSGLVAHVIEQHDLEVALELRRYETPHILVAAEAMSEHHSPVTAPTYMDVVSRHHIHVDSLIVAVFTPIR